MTALLIAYLIIGCTFAAGAILEATLEDENEYIHCAHDVAIILIALVSVVVFWPTVLLVKEAYIHAA